MSKYTAEELRNKVNEGVEWYTKLANQNHPGFNFEVPEVRWCQGTTAGWAAGGSDWYIKLNTVLLVENPEEMLGNTLPHEVAHLIDKMVNPHTRDRMFGKRSIHGPTWKAIMREFGCDPTRTHHMDVTNARKSTKTAYVYRCPTCGREETVGPKLHKAMQALAARGRPSNRWWKRCARGEGSHDRHKTYIEFVRIDRPEDTRDKSVLAAAAMIAAPKPRKQKAAPKPRTNAAFGSKLEHCRVIYKANIGSSRKHMINEFVSLAGCTPAGAATYYAKLKKEWEA